MSTSVRTLAQSIKDALTDPEGCADDNIGYALELIDEFLEGVSETKGTASSAQASITKSGGVPPSSDYDGCPCGKCIDAWKTPFERFQCGAVWMILCRGCGNKRCPHAADHDLKCTNSNELNQEGSR